ncbi:MAG: ATP-binding protein [Acidobacteriota bacterium]
MVLGLDLSLGTEVGEAASAETGSTDRPEGDWLARTVRLALDHEGFRGRAPRKLVDPVGTPASARAEVDEAAFVLACVSSADPSVAFYLGVAKALARPIVALRRFDAERAAQVAHQADLELVYDETIGGREALTRRLREVIGGFRRTAQLDREILLGSREPTLDWALATAAGVKNLGLEVLLREGFTRPRWAPAGCHEIDLLAARPRRGDDGRTLLDPFLVSLGGGLDDAGTQALVAEDIARLAPALLRGATPRVSSSGARGRADDPRVDLTLLFVWQPSDDDRFAVDPLLLRRLAARLEHLDVRPKLRLRWGAIDRVGLETLIRRHPMLLRHYFSELPELETGETAGGRAEPGRLDVEGLYRRAIALADRAALASAELEQRYGVDPALEWQRRAYTVTHSIGNVIFPVETYLDFLGDRLARDVRGRDLVEQAKHSLEKAKIHVRRFKDIARIQHAAIGRVEVVPRLSTSLRAAEIAGIEVKVFADPTTPAVRGNADHVDEAFDELVANAVYWLCDAEEATARDEPRRLSTTVRRAEADDLPSTLAGSAERFVWIRLEDNGPGIEPALKEKIFELSMSTNPRGMGYGLAIVRDRMREVGGDVVETGMRGLGARFDLFMPVADSEDSSP